MRRGDPDRSPDGGPFDLLRVAAGGGPRSAPRLGGHSVSSSLISGTAGPLPSGPTPVARLRAMRGMRPAPAGAGSTRSVVFGRSSVVEKFARGFDPVLGHE